MAICCLHSYANDAHEQRLGEILGAALPELSLSLSSEVSPEIREYDRMSTTAANAYVRPKMNSYLGRLQDELRHRGFGCPLLMIMSSGGMTTLETARKFPIRLVESGPAGGAIFSGVVARQCNEDKVLSFDMGGTTAKICLLDAGKPQLARSMEVAREYRFLKGSGIPIRIPVIEMVEIGAGGGSIASVSELGTIAVGPTSAGSEPGPASYGRGGVAPTVTDADLVLGRLDPLHFAGGSFGLSTDAALAAIDTIIGKPLGYDPLVAATGISEIVDENMANAAQIHGAESGKELSERTLIAFGGAAPNHAVRLAEKLGMDKVIIPVHAGVGSAVGFLRAPIAYEVIRSRLLDLRQFSPDIPNGIFAEIRREAQNVVGLVAQDIELFEVRTAYMRYRGQGHEIPVSVPAGELTDQDRDRLHRSFEDEYRRVFGRIIPKLTSEIVSWGLSLGTEPPVPASIGEPKRCRQITGRTRRRLFDTQTESAVEVPAFERAELAPGDWCDGPCVVVEDETSTFVSGNFVLGVNDLGYLVLTRRTTE